MKSFFQRRKHEKLNDFGDDAQELTQRPSDVSCSCDSYDSFDPNSYTPEAFLHSPIMEIGALSKSDFPTNFTPNTVNSRRCWTLGWPSRKQRHQLSSLRDVSFSGEPFNETEKLKKELTELDQLERQLRSKFNVRENPFARNDAIKFGSNSKKDKHKEGSADKPTHLLREATWRRRVSSLEAFFQNETKSRTIRYRDQAHESDIKKVVSFDNGVGDELSPSSTEKNNGSHDSFLRSSVKKNSTKKNLFFGESIEQSVSGVLGEITSKGEEILDSVPDWSVGSSSVDHYASATSDDEDTSFSGFPSRQQFSWNGVDRSSSSGDDDDDDDGFISQAGCNSIQSCDFLSSEIGTLLREILPRHPSEKPSSTDKRRKK
jgi:hypothetical protein